MCYPFLYQSCSAAQRPNSILAIPCQTECNIEECCVEEYNVKYQHKILYLKVRTKMSHWTKKYKNENYNATI